MNGHPIQVRTTAGVVEGTKGDRYASFRAVPYGRAPVGPLRFKRSQPVEPWDGVRSATEIGPACPQARPDRASRTLGDQEVETDADCLHLTVHTPDTEAQLPVFVWIHGGSYLSGSSSWRVYDTSNFARDGIVGVSITYRLHALGFVSLEGLSPCEDGDRNQAVGDAALALKWIRDNIAAFGGHPNNVTIAGESAGGGMVSSLLAMPRARRLFHRAIIQSGLNPQQQPPGFARGVAESFLRGIDVRPGDRAALEAVPVDRIVEVANDRELLLSGHAGYHLPWNAQVDPATLPMSPMDVLASGELAHLDILIGTTADENKLVWIDGPFPGGDYPPLGLPDDLMSTLRAIYREQGRGSGETWQIDEAIGNDQSYLLPATRGAELHHEQGGRVFAYLFTWASPVLDGRLGSCHALENAFVFDRLEAPGFHGDDPPQSLADAIHGAWVRFASTGDPNGPSLPAWPPYDVSQRPVMELGKELRVLSDPRGPERRAWDDVATEKLGVG